MIIRALHGIVSDTATVAAADPALVGTMEFSGTTSDYLTNFHWVKGTALYTANFSTPKTPISPVANTKLLLLATTSGAVTSDSSGLGKTVTNTGVSWRAFNYPTMP